MINQLLLNYPNFIDIHGNVEYAFNLLKECYKNLNKVLLCGNGGSASDCEHIVGELMKEFKIKRSISQSDKQKFCRFHANSQLTDNLVPALSAISLVSNLGLITALCNDSDADNIFAQQVYVLGNENDVLWAISTSGNSENVVRAAITAKVKGMKVIAMTGADGGKLKEYADVLINVPEKDTAKIQELHTCIYHVICEMLEYYFFASKE